MNNPPVIRTISHTQIGSAPFSLFFQKKYLLMHCRVRRAVELSKEYTMDILNDYEIGVNGVNSFRYDNSRLNDTGKRDFPAPTDIVNNFVAGASITYVFTFLEFQD